MEAVLLPPLSHTQLSQSDPTPPKKTQVRMTQRAETWLLGNNAQDATVGLSGEELWFSSLLPFFFVGCFVFILGVGGTLDTHSFYLAYFKYFSHEGKEKKLDNAETAT